MEGFVDSKIYKRLAGVSNKKRIVFTPLFFCFSLICFLFSGIFSSNTKYEQAANEISQVLNSDKMAGDCFNFSIKANDASTIEKNINSLQTYAQSINNVYYKTNPMVAVTTLNASKEYVATIDEFGELGESITFITSSAFSNHKDTINNIIFDRYYIKLMFEQTNSGYSDYDNFTYISESQARIYLEQIDGFDGTYDYSQVIDKSVKVVFDNKTYNWRIANIYYEDFVFNQLAKSSFGNYLICHQTCPNWQGYRYDYANKFELVWSLRSYKHQAFNYLQTMCSEFLNSKYTISVLRNNLDSKNSSKIDHIEKMVITPRTNDVAFYIFSSLSFIVLVFSFFFYILWQQYKSIYSYFIQFGAMLVVLLLTELISLITMTIYISSSISLLFCFITLCVHFVLHFSLFISSMRKKGVLPNNEG